MNVTRAHGGDPHFGSPLCISAPRDGAELPNSPIDDRSHSTPITALHPSPTIRLPVKTRPLPDRQSLLRLRDPEWTLRRLGVRPSPRGSCVNRSNSRPRTTPGQGRCRTRRDFETKPVFHKFINWNNFRRKPHETARKSPKPSAILTSDPSKERGTVGSGRPASPDLLISSIGRPTNRVSGEGPLSSPLIQGGCRVASSAARPTILNLAVRMVGLAALDATLRLCLSPIAAHLADRSPLR